MKTISKIEKPSQRDIYYHRALLQGAIYLDVVQRFAELAEQSGFTKKQLAEAVGKDAAQINRLFAEPGNWTLATISDLLLGMGCKLDHRVSSIHSLPKTKIEVKTILHDVVFNQIDETSEIIETSQNYRACQA